jgi:hypothetical protein
MTHLLVISISGMTHRITYKRNTKHPRGVGRIALPIGLSANNPACAVMTIKPINGYLDHGLVCVIYQEEKEEKDKYIIIVCKALIEECSASDLTYDKAIVKMHGSQIKIPADTQCFPKLAWQLHYEVLSPYLRDKHYTNKRDGKTTHPKSHGKNGDSAFDLTFLKKQ